MRLFVRKSFMAALTLSLTIGIVAGCSSAGSSTTQQSGGKALTEEASNEVVKLTAWRPETDPEPTQAYKEVIAAFNEAYKGKIEAEITFIPRGNKYAYEDKVNTAASSRTLPDALALDGPNVANYADAGIIIPIEDLLEDKEDYVPSIITQGTFDGKLYTVGPTESSIAIFYNKKLLEAAGITPPATLEEAWTWDEFYDAAKKLTKDGVYGVNWTLDYGEWIIYFSGPFVWSNGGSFISEDGSTAQGYVNGMEAVEALSYLQKFTNEKLVNLQPTPTEFEEGKAAMKLALPKQAIIMEKFPETEWGVTYFPYSKTKSSPSGDWNWGITSNSKYPEETATLINFMMKPENMVKLANAAGKPAGRQSAMELQTKFDNYPMSVFKEQVLNTAHPRPSTTSYPVLSQKYGEAVQNIFLGSDVQASLDEVAKAIDEDIKRKK